LKVHVVAGVFGGCFDYLEVFTDIEKARKALSAQLEAYGLTDEDKPDNQHNQECRWNDENELHLHSVKLQ